MPTYTTCFDPSTCQSVQKQCGSKMCLVRGPCETKTRQVTTCRTVCEQVPCTTMKTRTICQKVPTTVCKKIPYTVVDRVPMTITRMEKKTSYEQVPYVCTTMVKEVVRKSVPVTVQRVVRGCYCDGGNCGTPGYDCDAPGRVFKEGGVCTRVFRTRRREWSRRRSCRRFPSCDAHVLRRWFRRSPTR